MGQPQIGFSVHRNTPEEIEAARHPFEMVPRDEVVLILDHRQNGLGTASCGPGVLPQYQLAPAEFSFSVLLSALPAEDGAALPPGLRPGAPRLSAYGLLRHSTGSKVLYSGSMIAGLLR